MPSLPSVVLLLLVDSLRLESELDLEDSSSSSVVVGSVAVGALVVTTGKREWFR